jgi:phospholipid-binding lipoprotein MlaA
VDRRADLLTASQILDDAAIDSYSFLRDTYLERRHYLVHDGNPPPVEDEADFWNEVEFDEQPAAPQPAPVP